MYLAQEIYDHILSYLSGDEEALKACSLTCLRFLPPAQKIFFLWITIGPVEWSHGANGPQLERLLRNSPHIAAYIRYLLITDTGALGKQWYSDDEDTTLRFCLPRLRRLEGLMIDVELEPDTIKPIFPRGFYDSDLEIMQFPSIIYLALYDVPPELLQYCPNLKHLTLHGANTDKTLIRRIIDVSKATQQAQGMKRICLESLRVAYVDFSWQNWVINDSMLDLTGIKRLHVLTASCTGLESLVRKCAPSLEELALCDDFNDNHKKQVRVRLVIDWSTLTNLKKLSVKVHAAYRYKGCGVIGGPSRRLCRDVIDGLSLPSLEEFYLQINYPYHANCSGPDLDTWSWFTGEFSDRERLPRLRKFCVDLVDPDCLCDDLEDTIKTELCVGPEWDDIDCQINRFDEEIDIPFTSMDFPA